MVDAVEVSAPVIIDRALIEELTVDVHPCEVKGHAAGQDGCEPAEPAAWVIELLHPTDPAHTLDEYMKSKFLRVCAGHVAHLRNDWAAPMWCARCGHRGPLSDWIRIVGPISQVSA